MAVFLWGILKRGEIISVGNLIYVENTGTVQKSIRNVY